MTLYKQSLI